MGNEVQGEKGVGGVVGFGQRGKRRGDQCMWRGKAVRRRKNVLTY
jgi:hypothetical protein